MKINISDMTDKELADYSKSQDIRNLSKEEAMMKLFRAEMSYIIARGWIIYCGTVDDKFCGRGSDNTTLYSLDEALSIQKKEDRV